METSNEELRIRRNYRKYTGTMENKSNSLKRLKQYYFNIVNDITKLIRSMCRQSMEGGAVD